MKRLALVGDVLAKDADVDAAIDQVLLLRHLDLDFGPLGRGGKHDGEHAAKHSHKVACDFAAAQLAIGIEMLDLTGRQLEHGHALVLVVGDRHKHLLDFAVGVGGLEL